MVALHPWNTARWDAESWCDTLVAFAEANDLILACPDGGADGQVDDDIDTAFTSALIDSMRAWYPIHSEKVFCMGFSWGGLTTYSYGMRKPGTFCGYMPIGAAINGAGDVNSVANNVTNKPVYIVHGANDNASNRYWPALTSLTGSGAILNSILLPGVGHTIDFANRNQILTDAFMWIDSVGCSGSSTGIEALLEPATAKGFTAWPNPASTSQKLTIELKKADRLAEIELLDLKGNSIPIQFAPVSQQKYAVEVAKVPAGMYLLRVTYPDNQTEFTKILLLSASE